ncbi:MAG: hypothetical protein R3B90_11885 [Planctomycetaceae bacterium]
MASPTTTGDAAGVSGTVKGLKEGASTNVTVSGDLLWYNLADNYLSGATLTIDVQGGIGAVAPGIEAKVKLTMTRAPAATPGNITAAVIDSIPLDPPPQGLQLVFDAGPWGVRLRHDRGWYVFHAILDQPPKVAILRLLEEGSLIAQCNISPIPAAPPGEHTPIDEFVSDIRKVLGKSLEEVRTQEVRKLTDRRTLVEVIAVGTVEGTGKDNDGKPVTIQIPMQWRYYIVADASGRQLSCVFTLEESLVEQLGTRDRTLVESIEFLGGR